jgi:hypothetical protein
MVASKLGSDGDLEYVNGKRQLVYDDEALRQLIDCRLRLFVDEWFRDTSDGTDWYGEILGETTELQWRAELRRRLLSTPGIASIAAMELSIDEDGTLSGEITLIKVDGLALDVRFGEDE